MPSNTAGIAGMYMELLVDIVKTMPPREKKFKFFFGSKHIFDQFFI